MQRPPWVLLLLITTLPGCDPGSKVSDADIKPFDYEQLLGVLNDPKHRAVLIDVRSAEAYAQGHIPGAINIYLPDIRRGDGRLSVASTIIVYASGEVSDPLSAAGVKKMLESGYKNVVEFRGGLKVWRERGGEVVTGADS